MLRTQLYDKRDDFNFLIVNFPFIWSNVPATSAYGLYISQLIRYSRACGSYHEFLDRRLLLTRKSLNQGFLVVKLKSPLSLKSFTVASTTWLTTTEYLCYKWPQICSVCRNCNMILSSFITYYRVCNKSNTTVATYGTGNAYPPGKLEFTPGFFSVIRVAWSLVSCLCSVLYIIVCPYGPLYCLRFMTASDCQLISSNFSVNNNFLYDGWLLSFTYYLLYCRW
jgi:hypothetical protein